ncbi:hypothetical protein NBRC3299_1310 [Acetobacter pasteurianus NBRC 3299]|uniref:Uncharacterized protein n=1 Tax=Acetobacter ascendens TaxID=481146 RepID=A0A1Y0V5F2_9PROT|nr:hypothetical protein S101447_02565 [Acetobacter ascendens]GCD75018.1 hypothetical protein NBRC3299_1310 [Acetobacter pasteurianus NBRC 3299]
MFFMKNFCFHTSIQYNAYVSHMFDWLLDGYLLNVKGRLLSHG